MSNFQFNCIDLFCGAGGLSLGFSEHGFKIIAANDFDEMAAQTYRASHPETAFLPGPIENIDAKRFLDDSGLKQGDLDCIIGGPPCQAFSIYNHKRGMHDYRSGLFREYLRIVETLSPKFVILENVTGILSAGGGAAVEEIHARLTDLGYSVYQKVLKAEEYGVPQERRRVFFVGTRINDGAFEYPTPSHGEGSAPYVTIEDALFDLPELAMGSGDEVAAYTHSPSSDFQKLMRNGATQVYNHVAPFLSHINMERLRFIPQGGSWRDVPVDLLPAGMKKARRSDHTKRYGRLHPEGLASTILTRCDLHWGAYIHPTQERTLTPREAARLQSFPDKMRFLGCRADQFKQIGNAVPPLLAKAVASSVRMQLDKYYENAGTCPIKAKVSLMQQEQLLI